MDIMATGRGIGRGRGRGKQQIVSNGLILDCSLPVSPPSEQPSIINGHSMTRGRGRGRGLGLRPRSVVPMVSDDAKREKPFSAFGSAPEDNAPRHSEEKIKNLRKFIEKTLKFEDRSQLCKSWAYPRGIIKPILVLSMNEFLNNEELYIPGEISLAPFTLKDGIDLMTTFWTLVDPSTNIPPECQDEVNKNATNYGFPLPNPYFNGQDYQNYKVIVEGLEAFIKASSNAVHKDKDGNNVIFCQKEFLSDYTAGLDWLYIKAGKGKFPHKLVGLECLLVTLSHGGLRNQAERKGFGEQTFPQILNSFSNAVQSISRSNVDEALDCSVEAVNAEAQFILSKLINCFVSRTRFTQYITLGERTARIAGRRLLAFPEVFLGAFLSEAQAAQYLQRKDYTNKDHLACDYHQGNEQIWKCARFNVVRMIYTALDVLLANYEIEPREGHHFPQFSYFTFI